MSMSRRDYVAIAAVLKNVPPHPMKNRIAFALSRTLRDMSRLDINGNKLFDSDVFLAACGIYVEEQ